MSIRDDPRAIEEGLNQLVELGVVGLKRRRHRGRIGPDEIGMCVTRELVDLCHKTVYERVVSQIVLRVLERWAVWMILGVRHSSSKERSAHRMSQEKATSAARIILAAITRTLRLWEASSDIAARESLHLLQEVLSAFTSAKVRMRMRFSEVIIQLADCVASKLIDGPRSDFNLSLRSLIRMCDFTINSYAWSFGGKIAISETTRALQTLGESGNNRDRMSPWVLGELHNLTDKMSQTPIIENDQWRRYLRAIADLQDAEVVSILRGPQQSKQHNQQVSHAWAALVISRLSAKGRSEAIGPGLSTAIGLTTNLSDLPGLVAVFGRLADEYVKGDIDSNENKALISKAAGNIRARFDRDPSIVKARRRPRLRAFIQDFLPGS